MHVPLAAWRSLRAALVVAAMSVAPVISGCGGVQHKPDMPGKGLLIAPELVTVERRQYVPVPEKLTEPEPVAVGSIAECFAVAADRRAALERANGKLRSIAVIQGTEVAP